MKWKIVLNRIREEAKGKNKMLKSAASGTASKKTGHCPCANVSSTKRISGPFAVPPTAYPSLSCPIIVTAACNVSRCESNVRQSYINDPGRKLWG